MARKPEPTEALVLQQQQLLPCLKGTWNSLAVIPASPEQSASRIAAALAQVSHLVRGREAKLFTTEGLEVSGVARVIVNMTHQVDDGGLAVVAVESVLAKQSGVPVALAADAALLVVTLGVTRLEDCQRTLELVGAAKFIGAVTVDPA
jgi:phosphoribosylformylglycinamidine (FGAM) synthase-like enzyme